MRWVALCLLATFHNCLQETPWHMRSCVVLKEVWIHSHFPESLAPTALSFVWEDSSNNQNWLLPLYKKIEQKKYFHGHKTVTTTLLVDEIGLGFTGGFSPWRHHWLLRLHFDLYFKLTSNTFHLKSRVMCARKGILLDHLKQRQYSFRIDICICWYIDIWQGICIFTLIFV